jgi:SAM-dependent methyltransferase
MSLRFHEIAEARHRILNPFTHEQLMLLGDICCLTSTTRQLDLCCGKGEMLCVWSQRYGIRGIGVDISPVFLKAAYARAVELNCSDRITFVESNASTYAIEPGAFDVVSCIGATWIGGGLAGTVNKLKRGLRSRDSPLLVGEPYWFDEPSDDTVRATSGGNRAAFASLDGTRERIESAGLELIEMVMADHHGWDRYIASQWHTVSDWLRANPDCADADKLREWISAGKREHLAHHRRYLGWGVFVARLI